MRSLISDSFMDLMKSEKGSQRGSKCLSVSIIICLPHYNKNSIFNLCNYIFFFLLSFLILGFSSSLIQKPPLLLPRVRKYFSFRSSKRAFARASKK